MAMFASYRTPKTSTSASIFRNMYPENQRFSGKIILEEQA